MWVLLGLLLSAAWLGAVYFWFDNEFGLENLAFLLPGEIGQFLAGVAAPLALIWVLIGFFRTGSRLRHLSAAVDDLGEGVEGALQQLARRIDEATAAPSPQPSVEPPVPVEERSDSGNVTAIASEVARTLDRIDAGQGEAASSETLFDPEFRQQVKQTSRDLNAICMDLSAVLCRKAERDEALKSYNRGQKDAFSDLVRDYLSRHDPSEIMARLAQADAHSLLHTYAVKFAGLLDEAARRDASGVQEASLRQTAMGQLYVEVERHTSSARS